MVPNFDRKSFEVNGQLVVHGVTIAHHLHSHSKSGPFADEAWSILSGLRAAGRFPLVLTVVDSEVTAILSRDGEDFVNRILPLTDETLRGRLTEVSIGSLEPSLETDWSINSQLNEPAGGIHLGIGAGEEARVRQLLDVSL